MADRTYYSESAKLQARRERGLVIAVALSIGIGIGSAVALLFAPQEGEAIREDLAKTVEKRVKTMEKQVSELRSKLEDRVADLT